MFCKASMVTVALALMASATPVAQTSSVIPLGKRNSLTREDGVFDHEKAILHNVAIHNKYQRNLRNLQANTGHLPEGWVIKDFKTAPVVEKRATGTVSLTDQDDDEEWTGTVGIGSPAQSFVIDFDTGSSDLWVPNSSCKSSTCKKKHVYTASKSSTTKTEKGTFSIEYGDGSSVSGPIYADTVTVGGIKVTGQYLSAVTTLSSEFSDDPADGILGLAYPSISNLNSNPFFNTAIDQNAVSAGVFGFKLATSGSELFLGGTDTSKYTGSIEYHSIDTSTGFWQATGASAVVGTKTTNSNFDTIIDSGTTIMYGPPSAVATLFKSVSGSTLYDKTNGYYSYPCSTPPTIGFKWGGKTWTISAANLNLGTTSSGSKNCVSALAAQDLGLGNNVWLLGDSFMKNVYTAFSFDEDSVGFATLA